MQTVQKYKCTKCNSDFEKENIRFNGGKSLYCVYCLGIKNKAEEARVASAVEKPKEEEIEYACGHCNFSFKRKKSFLMVGCPYCSRKESVYLKKDKSADSLLKDSLSIKMF